MADPEEVGEEVLADPEEVGEEVLADLEEVGEEDLADLEEVGEEEQVDQGVQVVQVALAGQGELATQEVVDTAAMAEEDQEILGMIPQGAPPTTPCLNLRTCLAC